MRDDGNPEADSPKSERHPLPTPAGHVLRGAREGVRCGLRSGAIVGRVTGFLLGLPVWWACVPLPTAGLGALAGVVIGVVAGALGGAAGADTESLLVGVAL